MKLIFLKNQKRIFELDFRNPDDSSKGEVDIILRPGKKIFLNNVIAGNYIRHFSSPKHKINGISWHGYYKSLYKDKNKLLTPTINIKENENIIDSIYHFGSINYQEQIPFPICSLYIPKFLNISHLGKSKLKTKDKIIEEVDPDNNIRLDIFVLPKDISIKTVTESKIMPLFHFMEIDTFSSPEGEINIIEDRDKVELKAYEVKNGNDVFLRKVTNPNDMYEEAKNSFSLVLHDPNGIYNRLLNREFIEIDGDNNCSFSILRDEYEKEIGLQLEHRDKIHFNENE